MGKIIDRSESTGDFRVFERLKLFSRRDFRDEELFKVLGNINFKCLFSIKYLTDRSSPGEDYDWTI